MICTRLHIQICHIQGSCFQSGPSCVQWVQTFSCMTCCICHMCRDDQLHVSLELLVCVEDFLTWTTVKCSSMCAYMVVQFHFSPVYLTTYYTEQTILGFPTTNCIHSVLCRWMWYILIVTSMLTQTPRKKTYSICFIHCNEHISHIW
jgi:hypothetical protein